MSQIWLCSDNITVNLDQWCKIDERIHIAETDERFRQYAGLKHSIRAISQIAELKALSAKIFLDNFQDPRQLYLKSIESMADSHTKKLELKLYDLRNSKIVSKHPSQC